jgi:hypothetical protein
LKRTSSKSVVIFQKTFHIFFTGVMLFQASSGGIESFFRNGFFCLFVSFRVICLVLAGAASTYLFVCLYRSGTQLEYEFKHQNGSDVSSSFAPSFVLKKDIRVSYYVLHAIIGVPFCCFFIFIQSCYPLCCGGSNKPEKPPPAGSRDPESDGKVWQAICLEVVHFSFYFISLLFVVSFLFLVGNTRSTWAKCTTDNDNCKLLDHMQVVGGFECFLWFSLVVITSSIFCILHDLKKKMKEDTKYAKTREERNVPFSPVVQ